MRRRRAWRTREAKRVLALTAAAGAAAAAATRPAAAATTGPAATAATGAASAATTSPASAAAASAAADEHFRGVCLSHGCNTISESAAPAIRFKVKTGPVGV